MKPIVSVVIPCFNAQKYLWQTLQSLEEQSLTAFETIIVNDGSDDKDMLKYLDGLDKNKYEIINTENRGLPAARNLGISRATGEFILPLDSDDWLHPYALEQFVDKIKCCPLKTFCYSQIILFGSKQGILYKSFNPFEQLFFNQIPYCILFRKTAWANIGGYDENMTQGYEDWEFNIRLIADGFQGHIISTPAFNYRVSANGMLMSRSVKVHSQLWQYIITKHPQLYTFKSLFSNWKRCLHLESTRPTYLYFIWYFLFTILPHPLFNILFKILRPLRQSNSKTHRT